MQIQRLIQSLLRLRNPNGGKKNLLVYLVIAVVAVGGWYVKQQGGGKNGGPKTNVPLPDDGLDARCIRVVDGDTIEVVLAGKEKTRETIRILGIDTMEPHNEEKRAIQAKNLNTTDAHLLRMAKWASREMTNKALKQDVRLVFSRNAPKRDPYDRLLAYVEVDGADLGAELLKAGLAESRREPHDRSDRYRALNSDARRSRRGIYGTPQI